MSTHSIPDLLQLWSKHELTVEQARPGGPRHMLQNLLALFQWRSEVEKRLRALEQPPHNPQA